MGNRGILHDHQRQLGKPRWKHKAWVTCVLKWKDWHRSVMTPGAYTELFFFDEAVALAAGHRPCALCRRGDYNAYRRAVGLSCSAPEMDRLLHAERAIPRTFAQRRHKAKAEDLADGVVILDTEPKLILGAQMHPVGPGGYHAPEPRIHGEVTVLTPPMSQRALANGYVPKIDL